jgi:hypothetical protein
MFVLKLSIWSKLTENLHDFFRFTQANLKHRHLSSSISFCQRYFAFGKRSYFLLRVSVTLTSVPAAYQSFHQVAVWFYKARKSGV